MNARITRKVQKRINNALNQKENLIETIQGFTTGEERQEALEYIACLVEGKHNLPPLTQDEGKEIMVRYLGEKSALSLYVTPDEEAKLKEAGYAPANCVLIERIRGRGSVFISIPQIIGPIIVT